MSPSAVERDFAGGPSPGAEAESGSNQERQGIKGASDALWHVQHYLRWKADCGASGQRNEIHEHHAQAGDTKGYADWRPVGARRFTNIMSKLAG